MVVYFSFPPRSLTPATFVSQTTGGETKVHNHGKSICNFKVTRDHNLKFRFSAHLIMLRTKIGPYEILHIEGIVTLSCPLPKKKVFHSTEYVSEDRFVILGRINCIDLVSIPSLIDCEI